MRYMIGGHLEGWVGDWLEETWKDALETFKENIWRDGKEKCNDVVRRHVETLEGDTRIHESVDARQIGGQMDWGSMEA